MAKEDIGNISLPQCHQFLLRVWIEFGGRCTERGEELTFV